MTASDWEGLVETEQRVLILGIGNILWADEGIWGAGTGNDATVVRLPPPNVRFLDGGTQGIYLVQDVREADILIVFDAIDYGLNPGTMKIIENEKVPKFIESGQLGPFKNGYWDNPAYKLSPEADLMAVAHYLEALDLQKEFVKVHTVFGGKNPHPNYLVGGVPCAINMDGDLAAGAPLNMERLNFVKARIDEMKAFNDNVYVPDILAIASFYKKQLWGGGLGGKSVMDYGAYPTVNYDKSTDQLPGGVILDDNWDNVMPIDPRDPEQVQEFVQHSWYKYPDDSKGLHPWDGITEPNYELGPDTKGTRTNIEEIDENAKYSWIKAPRWRGHAVEVGPLSRYVLAYAQDHKYVKEQIHSSVAAFNKLAGTDLGAKAILQSTIGRTLARALESQYCSNMMVDDYNLLIANIKAGDSATANMEKWKNGILLPGRKKPKELVQQQLPEALWGIGFALRMVALKIINV